MAHVAVVLSGSGVYDGSELHEAVITLLRLSEKGAKVTIFAPDVKQMHVINHLTGKESKEKRNVLVEAARIARGAIKPLSQATARYDALILPGGFGAAKNLSNFAVKGAKCRVNRELEKLILAFHKAGKPIAPMCIAPTVVARVLGKAKIPVKLTIGNDPATAAAIVKMGAEHVECPVDDVVIDRKNRIVSAPAYMYNASISDVAKGIRKLVDATLKMVK
ncbi:MAG: isoprenoid biosynthesis glyoxalase ElbB [bacterium]